MPANGELSLIMTDQLGKEIQNLKLSAVKGLNNIDMNTEDFQAGIYTINLYYNGMNCSSIRMVKK
jgi:hypothetical protein